MAELAHTTLLVVDDSEFEHQVIARLLKSMKGLRLIFASGGLQALETVRRESPHLILTDLIMPDMDGLELVQEVRTNFPSIPLILMTAFGSEEAAMRALRAGAANYLPKKDLARDLTETIQKVLRVSVTDRHRRQLLRYLACRESTFQLGNDPSLITALIALIQEEIDGLGLFDRMGQIRVGVALQEALTNALFHGNLEVSSELARTTNASFTKWLTRVDGKSPTQHGRFASWLDLTVAARRSSSVTKVLALIPPGSTSSSSLAT